MVVSASQRVTQFCLNYGYSVSLRAADTESTISFRAEKVSAKKHRLSYSNVLTSWEMRF